MTVGEKKLLTSERNICQWTPKLSSQLCKFVQHSNADVEHSRNAQNLNNAHKLAAAKWQTQHFVECR